MSRQQILRMKGFTLVELLIVVVVIGMLVTVTAYGYTTAQQKAANSSVAAQVKTFEGTLRAYYAVKREYPVPDSANQPSGETILNPTCVAEANSGSNYCKLINGTGSPGTINGINYGTIADDLRDKLQAQNLSVPKTSAFPSISVTSTYDGNTYVYKGLQYKYYFSGTYPENIGVFIVYALYGRTCIGSDVEVSPAYGLFTQGPTMSVGNDRIVCQRLVSKTLR